MLLELRDLRVHYDKVEAVKGVSLRAEEGSICTLIGANGAGKTSILKAISGLLKPSSGEIHFAGARIDRLPAHRIVGLGVAHVPEGRRLFGLMTVEHNLRLGAYLQKDRSALRQSFEHVFEHFPILAERRGQLAKTLSGGQQQMVAMGRALMARPRLLLLDEPSLGLAPVIVERIFEQIARMKARGLTILLVEQNAHEALAIAERAYLLHSGRLSFSGPAEALRGSSELMDRYLGTGVGGDPGQNSLTGDAAL